MKYYLVTRVLSSLVEPSDKMYYKTKSSIYLYVQDFPVIVPVDRINMLKHDRGNYELRNQKHYLLVCPVFSCYYYNRQDQCAQA